MMWILLLGMSAAYNFAYLHASEEDREYGVCWPLVETCLDWCIQKCDISDLDDTLPETLNK